jgi:hypothetical protein
MGERTVRFIFVLSFVCIASCHSDRGMSIVTGVVSLDGEQLDDGIIRFVPLDGATPTADAKITKGRFRAEVPPGAKRVEIFASKKIGSRKMYDVPDAKAVDKFVERIPARYNVRSELTMTVDNNTQEKRFELTSQ